MAILNSVFILPADVLSALLCIVMMDHAHFAAPRRDEDVLSCSLNPSAVLSRLIGCYIYFLDARLFMHPPFCKHIAYRVESSCVGRVLYKYLVTLIFLFFSLVQYLNFFFILSSLINFGNDRNLFLLLYYFFSY